MPSIEKFCDAMRWAADSDRVGYSQSDRESLQEWGFFGDGDTNTDCSKLVIEALQYAGFDTGWATYTGNLSAALEANGWVRLPNDGDPQRGDILLNDADHVAVWLGDCLAQASIGEGGLVSGGARGDQTGWEVNTRGYYDYLWDCYLRYAGEQESEDDMVPNDVWAFNNDGDQEGAPGTAWRNLMDTNKRVQQIELQVAALSEAVKTLAQAKGADPEAIAKSVDKAVKARLEKIQLNVKAS